MVEFLLLISLIILGFATVQTDNLMRTVIYSGAFSLVMALAFLYYNAPDVALAEAAIGVGLSTIMFLVALKKIRVYSVYYVDDSSQEFDDTDVYAIKNRVIRPLEIFLEKTVEVEPQVSYTNNSLTEALKEEHEIIVNQQEELMYFYGDSGDEIFQDIVANLRSIFDDIDNIRIVYTDEEEGDSDD